MDLDSLNCGSRRQRDTTDAAGINQTILGTCRAVFPSLGRRQHAQCRSRGRGSCGGQVCVGIASHLEANAVHIQSKVTASRVSRRHSDYLHLTKTPKSLPCCWSGQCRSSRIEQSECCAFPPIEIRFRINVVPQARDIIGRPILASSSVSPTAS